MTNLPANTYICDLNPYRPGMPIETLARELGLDPAHIIKLASNENPAGMSTRSLKAAQQAMDSAFRYPDGYMLRQALAEFYNLEHSQVVLGNGSNDVLDLVARVFLAPGAEAVFSQSSFIVYSLVTRIAGARSVVVPEQNFGHDLNAMRRAITAKTKIVWIANPNNPTGTFVPYAQLKNFLKALPPRVIVVVDEAYYEYLPDAERLDTTLWLKEHPNLVLTRTFSKAYGLAGLRVGYALCAPQAADLLNRVRQPFNVSHPSLAAAVAALGDQAFVRGSRRRNLLGLQQIKAGLDKMGLGYLPTFGNFITIKFPDAPKVHQALLKQGIIVRPLLEYGMPEHLRVSVGTPAENKRFLLTLQKYCI